MSDVSTLHDFKRRAEAALPGRIRKMVLFGSQARGGAGADSDWDIAVFVEGEPDHAVRRGLSEAAFDLMMEGDGQFVHPIALALSRLDGDDLLARNIRRHGVPI